MPREYDIPTPATAQNDPFFGATRKDVTIDGKTYKGASPEQLERLIERAAASDIPAGVVGNKLFVVVGDLLSLRLS